MTDKLDTEELPRLNTWAAAIAQHVRPEAPVAYTAEGLRIGRKGSLAINADGKWHNHEAGQGGSETLSLIRHIKDCSAAEAVAWARTWLDQHPGEGELSADGAVEAAAEAGERRAAYARQILDEALDPSGTPAEAYLCSRGLKPPYLSCVRFLEDARLGEGAIVGIITTADGEVAGVHVAYLDPDGRKSTILPQRQLYLLDRAPAEQAAFRIAVAETAEGAAPLVIAEGLEDGLSLAQAGAAETILALPGIGRFSRFDVPAGADVIVFRDGDDSTSPAAKQLVEAVDRWLLAGVRVRVTDTPPGEDANSLLLAKGGEELRRLVAEAAPAELSFNADVVRLAGLEPVQYERERQAAAKRHDVRVAFLDGAVKAARADAEATAQEDDEDEAPHPEPVTDLAPVLDEALSELERYVVGRQHDLAAAVLWAAHAHLVHSERVRLHISPKLAVQSPDRGCGKTTLLEAIGALVPRPETGSSISAAATFRLIEDRRPALLLDEADRIPRPGGSEELIGVLNSSHRRSGAYVYRVEEVGGQRVPIKYSAWAAVAFAGIRQLPSTLQDRSIVVRLTRARPGEVKAHLRNGSSPILRSVKRRLARWAADLSRLPEAPLPSQLYNRTGDNWQPLLSIAAVAGGRWPELMKEAALASLAADQQDSQLVALLEGIHRAFGEQERLRTKGLLDFLLADDEHDWGTANRGKGINEAWLRERLRDVISPAADGKPGSERWGSGNNKERGYSRGRFLDAWQRYLPSSSFQNDAAQPDHPAQPLKTKEKSGADKASRTRPAKKHPVPGNGAGPLAKGRATSSNRVRPAKKPTKTRLGPDAPGGPGDSGSNGKGIARSDGELGPEELL